jgi:hypothetical protein
VSDPIQEEQRNKMNALAAGLDRIFNHEKTGDDREWCFVLLSARFGQIDGGRVNYISNGERDDCVSMLKEITARFEGRYVEAGESKQ